MANTATLPKKRKLDAFHQHHKVCEDLGFKRDPSSKHFIRRYSTGIDFQAGCQNQTYVLVPNRFSADGKSLPGFQVSARCRTQHSRLFNSTSANGFGKSNPLHIAKDTGLPLAGSVEHNFEGVCSDKVDETIKLFRKVLSDLKRKNMGKNTSFRPHIKAAIFLQKQGKWLNVEKRLGHVPGVGVYEEFQYRAELRVIGLHCQLERGIDYVKINGEILATSIVDSGRYLNKTDTVKSLDFLIYHGAGGNPTIQKTKPKDQRLVGGNLALYNSMRKKSPTEKPNPKSGDKQSMRSSGCDCTDGCSDSEDCSCKLKNGGIIPYNYTGCLVNPRSLIIECRPSCKCYDSCLNRVSQRLRLRHSQHEQGPIFELEMFRCRLGFLGVRSRCFIPKGSFVCKYEEGIGRLINRSTSPNLFAQKVLYDHEDDSRPQVMLFTVKDIPDVKELTIGEVSKEQL
ncbi:hypothetical protein CRYUN_Cryun26dG0133600 [Craigia yunnanensis]